MTCDCSCWRFFLLSEGCKKKCAFHRMRLMKLVDMQFPKGHILHKIFNRNTIKVSYSCMGFHATASLQRQDQYRHRKEQEKIRHHNIRWFNPPYSESVQTNVGQKILKLVDRHFPKGHILHKIFNRNTIKVSYSCMGNMKSLINRHNTKILQAEAPTEAKGCNCRKNSTCPLNGACLTESLVYKATVLAENHEPQTYIGMTEHNFKTQFRNHKMSFENPNYRSSTTLSKYIWNLKEDETNYKIKWSIVKCVRAYKSGDAQCHLCLQEKLCILNAEKKTLLNKRSELLAKCRHRNKFYAANYKPP